MNHTNPPIVNRPGRKVLGTFIDALNWKQSIKTIINWAEHHDSRTVCLCNVHSSVTATEDLQLAKALARSDMVLPDGAPIAWMLRRNGYPHQTRIAGPDLMIQICEGLDGKDISIFLFGSTPEILHRLESNLRKRNPALNVAGCLSPKYGEWSNEEQSSYIDTINQSGAGIIFVGLGCPKQETWMLNNRDKIHGVLLGVGAAFDFHAETVKRAPLILQQLGLEWLHRLISEPRRLWRRYLVTNTRFIILSLSEILKKPATN